MTNPPSWLTWAEFKDAVLALVPIDRNRVGRGIQDDGDTEGYLTKTIRQGCLDVQGFVPRYRLNHESIYLPEDLVVEGAASRGVLPQQALIRDVWFWVTATNTRYPAIQFPWDRRFELVNEQEDVSDVQARITSDPARYTFYVYPVIAEGNKLSIFWDGLKAAFEADDHVPFDEQMAGAVADYLKGRIARDIEKDNALYATYFHPNSGSYITKRTNLYIGVTP